VKSNTQRGGFAENVNLDSISGAFERSFAYVTMLYNSQTGQWFQCLTQTGADPFSYRNGSWATGWTVTRAAFNGDGRDDLFVYNGRSTAVDSNSGRWFRVVTQSDLSFAYFEGEQRWVAGWREES